MLKMLMFLSIFFTLSNASLWAENEVHKLMIQGNQFAAEKRYGEAIQQYEAVLKTDPKNAKASLLLGIAYANINKFDEAIRHAQKASEGDPSYAAFYNLGLIYAANNQPLKSLEAFDQALEHSPDSYQAEYQKGVVYSIQEDYEKAAHAYQRSIELNPMFDDAHIGLTGAAYKQGGESQAAVHIEKLKAMQKNTLAKALEEWLKKQEGELN
jgi:tetratricopeptide (TPR) repeat protein